MDRNETILFLKRKKYKYLWQKPQIVKTEEAIIKLIQILTNEKTN